MTVTTPTFPCRVSLVDRALGESVLLLNHVSHDVANPYRATHAIFIAQEAHEQAGVVDPGDASLEAAARRELMRVSAGACAGAAGPGE